jgi:hypothetical protein
MKSLLAIGATAAFLLFAGPARSQTTAPAPAQRQTQIQKRQRIHALQSGQNTPGAPVLTGKQGQRSGVCDGTGPKGNRGGMQNRGGGRGRR